MHQSTPAGPPGLNTADASAPCTRW
jgi:hypothetical protein